MGIKAVDFFCGIGGVTRGFLDAGIDVIAGVDIDESCKKTYEHNNIRSSGKPVDFFCEDVRKFDTAKIKREVDRTKHKLVVIGCAPCQPFTGITKKLEHRADDRELLLDYADIIKDLDPDYIFIENVTGLLSEQHQSILNGFVGKLKPEFDITPARINAKYYGVPQERKRLVMFGKKNGGIEFPKPTYDKVNRPFRTLADVIKELPPITAGQQHPDNPMHVAAGLKEISLERLAYQDKPGDDMRKWPPKLQLHSRRVKEYKGHYDVYARLYWNRPASTLTTKFMGISHGRFAHPDQKRGLSVLEGLLIQTFGENFQMMEPGLTKRSRQIGNAVPVLLAKAFAEKIIEDVRSETQRLRDFLDQPF